MKHRKQTGKVAREGDEEQGTCLPAQGRLGRAGRLLARGRARAAGPVLVHGVGQRAVAWACPACPAQSLTGLSTRGPDGSVQEQVRNVKIVRHLEKLSHFNHLYLFFILCK